MNAEVVASTFDEPADRRAHRQPCARESQAHGGMWTRLCILLDSITRLAPTAVSPLLSKILSGGVEANALQKPKRFFGAARNIENGGSLSIIATA